MKALYPRRQEYIPQAGRGPAFPVFSDSSFPPLPRSSVPAWTTTVRYDSVSFSPFPRPVGEGSTYPNDALGADQLDLLIRDGSLAIALGVSLEIP